MDSQYDGTTLIVCGGPPDVPTVNMVHAAAVPLGSFQNTEGIASHVGRFANNSSHSPFTRPDAIGVRKNIPTKKNKKLKFP
jgi:hypothetical protein